MNIVIFTHNLGNWLIGCDCQLIIKEHYDDDDADTANDLLWWSFVLRGACIRLSQRRLFAVMEATWRPETAKPLCTLFSCSGANYYYH